MLKKRRASKANNDVPIILPCEWEGIDPYLVYTFIRTFQITKPVATQLPETYTRVKTWENFTNGQKWTIIQQFNALEGHLKRQMIDEIKNGQDSHRGAIVPSNWNKDDSCRLIHLFADPNMSTTLTEMTSVSHFVFSISFSSE